MLNSFKKISESQLEENREQYFELRTAVVKNNIGDARRLISTNPNLVKAAYNSHCETALLKAAELGRDEIVDLLITNGADVDATTTSSVGPLYYAVTYSHLPVVKKLIAAGADVNGYGQFDGDSIIHAAVKTGNPEIVAELCQAGANRYCKNLHGKTPMDLAVKLKNSAAMISALETPLDVPVRARLLTKYKF